MQQLALDIGLPATPTLARFYPGRNTAVVDHLRNWLPAEVDTAASAAALTAATTPDLFAGLPTPVTTPAPVYLCGPEGTGKTHLLHAIHHALVGQGLQVGWMDASMPSPPDFSPRWHAVLMDDTHRYTPQQQAMAFNWFVNATTPPYGPPRRILCAGEVPPAALPLREDLRTRLGWGHVFQLVPLNEEECRAAVLAEAAARGMPLGADVVDYMLRRFSRDLCSLLQLLDMLDNYALRNQRAITIPLLKAMLQSE